MSDQLKRQTIYHGDIVRIITPEVFVRCGYPLTVQSAQDIILKNHHDDIQELLIKIGINHRSDLNFLWSEEKRTFKADSRAPFNRLVRTLAYDYLRYNHFGGSQRSVYTQTEPELAGLELEVIGKEVVRTGEHYPRSGGGDDYEPGGLSNAKSHVILELQITQPKQTGPMMFAPERVIRKFQIEQCHVVLICRSNQKHLRSNNPNVIKLL